MLDFDPRHFTSSFNSSPYYNGDLNGFDVMVMNSSEKADQVIKNAKARIDEFAEYYAGMGLSFTFEYDDNDILPPDKKRIEQEINRYCKLRNL